MSANIPVRAREEMYPFLSEIAEVRRRARQHIRQSMLTPGDASDSEVVVRLLNEALATELTCVLRYRRHHLMCADTIAEGMRSDFLGHSQEEQRHAEQLARRIEELGGQPNFSPTGLIDRSHRQYAEGETLTDTLEEDLIAERIAIQSYREIIEFLTDKDVSTRRVFESILAVEEQHAEELANMRDAMLRTDRAVTAAAADHRTGELQ